MVSDLREGGTIEQDADIIILITRPLVYADQAIKAAKNEEQRSAAIIAYDDAKDVLEIAIPKHRGGKDAPAFRKCFINPGASAIRDHATTAEYDAAELNF